MAMTWRSLSDAERGQWIAAPLEGVGPLRFGMSHDQVASALAASMATRSVVGRRPGPVSSAVFSLKEAAPFSPSATLSVYYDSGLLAAIAVDARNGPQVVIDGVSLVGRIPSELDGEFSEYAESGEQGIIYNQRGDCCSEILGLVLRAQRVDDVVLSRPVLVSKQWSERCGDISEGFIPQVEWQIS